MNFNQSLTAIAALAAGMALSGCTDSDYDLSDIDTTVKVQVNDLVVPVNLSEIVLSDVIKIDNNEGDIIREIDGEYVILKNGDFNSDDIKVEETVVNSDATRPIVTTVYKYNGSGYLPPEFTNPEQIYRYEVTDAFTTFRSSTNNIPTNIRDIESVETSWTLSVDISLSAALNIFSKMAFHNIVFTLPEGLQGPEIAADGSVKIPDFILNGSHLSHRFDVEITNVDIAAFKADPDNSYTFTPGPLGSKGSLTMEGKIGLKSGEIIVETASASASAPGSVTMITAPSFSPIRVNTFTGMFYYSIDNFNVSKIDISNLPDFLNQSGTDIVLTNPQIYLSINNPLASYSLHPASGLSITPYRGNTPGTPASLDAGELVSIGSDKGVTGPYTFCLSPETPDEMYAPFAGAAHVGYASLSYVLSGDGMPTSLDVNFIDPAVQGHVTKFAVGRQLDRVEGKYTFYSPLNLKPGSKIVYSDTEDGWSDDTVEKLTVTSLKVNTTVQNALPLDVEISGYPINTKGEQCRDAATGKPVTITPVSVKGNTSADITLSTEGNITDLDGIVYKATVISDKSENLKPSGTLKLTDIRATVSGYYLDEL
ncbi:MAG: hypothetical protein ACI31E_01035 [Muribaculaceae bacterium]